MAVTSVDLTQSSLAAISNPRTFAAWAGAQSLDVAAGLASLGFFDHPDGLDASIATVNRHTAQIETLIGRKEWRKQIQDGVDAALLAMTPSHPDVRLYSLVGPARSNSSATRLADRGLVFIWLESWLGRRSTDELQDCDPQTLPAAVTHELAHAFRYTLPGSRDPIAIAQVHEVARVWPTQMHRCLRDAIYDEGLAVRFSLEATPQTNLLEALFMSEAQIEWLQTNWRALLADRERRGVLDEVSPSLELVGDALYFDPARTKPPFSIERPPAKWGYYLGLQWAHAAGGSWTTRLSSEPPRMGRHA